jgi:hypothetical protein
MQTPRMRQGHVRPGSLVSGSRATRDDGKTWYAGAWRDPESIGRLKAYWKARSRAVYSDPVKRAARSAQHRAYHQAHRDRIGERNRTAAKLAGPDLRARQAENNRRKRVRDRERYRAIARKSYLKHRDRLLASMRDRNRRDQPWLLLPDLQAYRSGKIDRREFDRRLREAIVRLDAALGHGHQGKARSRNRGRPDQG